MDHAADGQSESKLSIAPQVWIARNDLHFTFSRSSGPGGQAVNKLSTRAQLRVAVAAVHGLDESAAQRLRRLAGHRLTQNDEILIQAETFRSQLDNKHECMERLRALVAKALVKPTPRKKKKPTRAMKERRLKAKRVRSEKKRRRAEREF